MTDSPLPQGDAAALGFDPERLALIGPAMQEFVDDRRVPNLVTLLARRGQVVHMEARGVLDFDTGKPVGLDSLFRMYSNTKPVAGVATLILTERGVLTPDDPVSKFLPEFADQRVVRTDEPMMTEPVKRPMTVRDCLTNTTSLMSPAMMPNFWRQQYRAELEALGWVRPADGSVAEPSARGSARGRPSLEKPISNRERVRILAGLPLAAHPGERFVYHLGYPILGAVLEEAVDEPLDVFFRDNIFEPLGMNDTDFYLKQGALPRFGANYAPQADDDGTVRLVCVEKADASEKHVGPRTEFGVGGDAGGILTTVGDYARFGQMLLNGGELEGARILGRKIVDLMIGNHTGDMRIPMTGPGFHWGLGVANYHGRDRFPLIRSVGTYGWGGAAGTTYFADPAEELLGVCLTQVLTHGTMPNNNYQETFQRLAYQALA